MKKFSFALALMLTCTPLSTPSAAVGKTPDIGEIQWYQADSYCSFFAKGHVFDFKRPETWRFVFMTSLVSDVKVSVERGYARIDGLLRELELVGRTKTDNGEKRIYRTFGDAPITLTVSMVTGEKGEEHTSFTGAISAKNTHGISVVPFYGDCGV